MHEDGALKERAEDAPSFLRLGVTKGGARVKDLSPDSREMYVGRYSGRSRKNEGN